MTESLLTQAQSLSKKGSELSKVLFLEEVVRTESPATISAVMQALGAVELSARALGIAGRYRGLEHVKALLAGGASFDYPYSPEIKAKYKAIVGSTYPSMHSHPIQTEYLFMLVLPKDAPFYESSMFGIREVLSTPDDPLPEKERLEILQYVIKYFKQLPDSRIKTHESRLFSFLLFTYPNIAQILAAGGAALPYSFDPDYKQLSNLSDPSVCLALDVFSKAPNFAGNVKPIPGDLVSPQWSGKTFDLIFSKFIVKGIKPVALGQRIIDLDNESALKSLLQHDVIKNPREFSLLRNYAIKTEKTSCMQLLDQWPSQSKKQASVIDNPDSPVESPSNWFLRKGTKLIGLSKKGIREIVENNIRSLTLPAEIGGYKIQKIHDTFFDDFAQTVPGIERLSIMDGFEYDTYLDVFPWGNTNIKELVYYNGVSPKFFRYFRVSINDKIENITFIDNKDYLSIDGVVFNKAVDTLIFYPRSKKDTEYSIPTTVKTIGRFAFQGTKNLKKLLLPEGLSKLEYACFSGSSIESIEIPGSLLKISDGAFSGTKIREIKFNEGLETIDEDAFSSCAAQKIVFPASLKKIEKNAFRDSTSTFEFLSNDTQIGAHAFRGCKAGQFLNVDPIIRRKIADYGLSPYDCGCLDQLDRCNVLKKEDFINILRVFHGPGFDIADDISSDQLQKLLKDIAKNEQGDSLLQHWLSGEDHPIPDILLAIHDLKDSSYIPQIITRLEKIRETSGEIIWVQWLHALATISKWESGSEFKSYLLASRSTIEKMYIPYGHSSCIARNKLVTYIESFLP